MFRRKPSGLNDILYANCPSVDSRVNIRNSNVNRVDMLPNNANIIAVAVVKSSSEQCSNAVEINVANRRILQVISNQSHQVECNIKYIQDKKFSDAKARLQEMMRNRKSNKS
jgi:hypothetical protein